MPSKPNKPNPSHTHDIAASEAAVQARQAQMLLENPMLVTAFEKLKETYTQAWQDSDYTDLDGRERAFRMIHAVEKLQQQLHEVVLNGKVESSRVRNTVAGR